VGPEPVTVEAALAVAARFEECHIPYAIGGAIAYGFYAEPRGTVDLDFNVFLPASDARAAMECLVESGLESDVEVEAEVAVRQDQVRLRFRGLYLDLFFDFSLFHESVKKRVRQGPLGGREVPVLSAEDLVIFKVLFNRPKDWVDIRQVLLTQGAAIDAGYVGRWLRELLGEEDPAVAQFDRYYAEARRDLP
jgi:hypothetical protein